MLTTKHRMRGGVSFGGRMQQVRFYWQFGTVWL